MAKGGADRPRLVLVGGSTSVGAEVKRRLAAARLGFQQVVLAESDPHDEEGARLLSEFDGEALLVLPVDEVDFARADLAVLCGDADRSRGFVDRASGARACIDVSGAVRGRDDVPWVHTGVQPRSAWPTSGLVAVPQPASTTIASLLAPLLGGGCLGAAAGTVLLPASALGEVAAEELYQQTLSLLNFTDLPRRRLAHQLAFNVLPWDDPSRPGSDRLAADLAAELGRLLGPGAPAVDLELLLAPTFHGYGYSLRLETEALGIEDLRRRLEGAGVPVGRGGDAPASPVEALQHGDRPRVGRLRAAGDGVFWLWAVADSLGGGTAANVVRVARHLLGAGGEADAGGRAG